MPRNNPRKGFIIAFVLITLVVFGVMSFQLYKTLKQNADFEYRLERVYTVGYIEGYEQALKDRQRRENEKRSR